MFCMTRAKKKTVLGMSIGQITVSFHNLKSQNVKLSVSSPKSKYVAYLSVLSQLSSCQSLGRKNKHDILKTDRNMHLCRNVEVESWGNYNNLEHTYTQTYTWGNLINYTSDHSCWTCNTETEDTANPQTRNLVCSGFDSSRFLYNATCLTHGFFKRGEYIGKLWWSLTRQIKHSKRGRIRQV